MNYRYHLCKSNGDFWWLLLMRSFDSGEVVYLVVRGPASPRKLGQSSEVQIQLESTGSPEKCPLRCSIPQERPGGGNPRRRLVKAHQGYGLLARIQSGGLPQSRFSTVCGTLQHKRCYRDREGNSPIQGQFCVPQGTCAIYTAFFWAVEMKRCTWLKSR